MLKVTKRYMNRYEINDMEAEALINRYKNLPKTNKAVFIIGIKNDNTEYLIGCDNCFDEDGSYRYALNVKVATSSIKGMVNTKTIIVVLARRIGSYFVTLKTRTIRG